MRPVQSGRRACCRGPDGEHVTSSGPVASASAAAVAVQRVSAGAAWTWMDKQDRVPAKLFAKPDAGPHGAHEL